MERAGTKWQDLPRGVPQLRVPTRRVHGRTHIRTQMQEMQQRHVGPVPNRCE